MACIGIQDFIDGYPFYKSEERAIQARMDIESLVNVLAFYMKRNPKLIIIIENPMGLLRHHPVVQLFSKVYTHVLYFPIMNNYVVSLSSL